MHAIPGSYRSLMMGSVAAIAAFCLFGAQAVQAQQAWPVKPVRVVVPFPPGGSTDIFARQLSRKLSDSLGQQFVVDNRAGANGSLGAAAVVTSAPDGYTVLFSTTGPLSLNKLMYKSTPYDPVKDFAHIILLADAPMLISAHPSMPFNNIPQLVAYLKANPGKLSYSTGGNGSMGHLSAELMERATGTSMVHVPYKGSAPAMTDLIAGVVNLSFDIAPTYLAQVKSGKVKAIGILGSVRTPVLPEVATLAEAGIPAYATAWYGLVGPAGMSAAVVDKINVVANEFLASTEGKQQLLELGLRPIGGKPADLARFVISEMAKWKPITDPLASIMVE